MDLKAVDERSSSSSSTTAIGFTSSSSTPIDSSNVGFKLLQKHGWKEGTGLGISEQGRLEPIQTIVKTNKRGLGAEKPKKSTNHIKDHAVDKLPKKKGPRVTKKMKKLQKLEEQYREKEFDQAFLRMFWPDNV